MRKRRKEDFPMRRVIEFGLIGLLGVILASWFFMPTKFATAQTNPSPPACAAGCFTPANVCRNTALNTFATCQTRCGNAADPPACEGQCGDALGDALAACGHNLGACAQAACRPS